MNQTNKKKSLKKVELNWKTNLMKILDCFAFEKGCWSTEKWKEYGVLDRDRERIIREYWNYSHKQNVRSKI